MKRTTIADVAHQLNISMNTVNKALYGKKGVGDELRAKILKTAEDMNYRVNRVAQSMARNPIGIGVIHHATDWSMITEPFITEIKVAVEQLRDYNVNGHYYQYHSSQERTAAFAQAISDGVDVVVCLHFVPAEDDVALLTEAKIPFALLGTDGMESRRLTSVRADSLMCGKLAAELLILALPAEAQVAVFTGDKNYRDHADKVSGFSAEMAAHGRRVVAVYEHFDLPEVADRLTSEALASHPGLAGIYSSTGNSVVICRNVVTRQARPLIVATDLYDEIKDLMRQGIISAAIYQNAPGQARKMVELLYSSLCEKQSITEAVFIPPSIVLRANIDAF